MEYKSCYFVNLCSCFRSL
uniref:Uncharacterized protein n=1 Tax=Arundo donax TaxID=35708 RepID=A0A0A9CAT1_ARUDO